MCERSGREAATAVGVRRAGWWAAAACSFAFASLAQAAEGPPAYNTFEITPFAGYMFGGEFEDPLDDSERDLDADVNFGVIFNAAADYWRHYELIYSRQGATLDGVTTLDMDVEYLQIGGTVSHPDYARVIPYFGITVGAARFSPDETGLDSETNLAFTVGGGLRMPITEHIGVRFDARAFVTSLDSDGEIFCLSDEGLTCRIRAKSDTFLQYSLALGVSVGF
jgi:opacity protein-like surface antigen